MTEHKEFKVVWSNVEGVHEQEFDNEQEALEFYYLKINERNINDVDLYHLMKHFHAGVETNEVRVGDILYTNEEIHHPKKNAPLAIYVVEAKAQKTKNGEYFLVRGIPIAKNGTLYYRSTRMHHYQLDKIEHNLFEVLGDIHSRGYRPMRYYIQRRNVSFMEVCPKDVIPKMNKNLRKELETFLPEEFNLL